MKRPPKALVLHHYMHPDDVVSAVLVTDLCVELVRRGWEVKAMPGNRSCRHESLKYAAKEQWCGVNFQRVWRPELSQTKALGRLLNAIWMTARWSLAAVTEAPDVLIVGTEPVLSVTVAGLWKVLRPRTRIAHWCFDLYPEAAIAGGILRRDGWFARLLNPVLTWSYGCCDLL